MADERFGKLLNVMSEMKQTQEEMKQTQEEMKQEMQEMRRALEEKIDNLGSDVTLLAKRQWENDRSIHRLQQHML
jgi:hypothetical protein